MVKTVDGREVYGISGGPMPDFREGWALLPFFGFGKPHYWKRVELSKTYVSRCGHEFTLPSHRGVQPLAAGVFMEARCGHCQRIRQRETRFVAGRT